MRQSHLHNLRERGQILSSEFIIAAVIFMFVLGAILFMWTMTTFQINQSELVYTMDESATNAAEKLVRTGGLPHNWSSLAVDNISSLGLVNESRVIDQGKLDRFMILMDDSTTSSVYDNPCNDGSISPSPTNYECNRHFLGLGRYDFNITVNYLDGTSIDKAGVSPSDADYIISKRRNALLDNEVVVVTLTVWYGYE